MTDKKKAPVFVLGSPRSGTTLLYHMILSSGGFAVYRTESQVFSFLATRFGTLSKMKNRKKLMKAWLESKLFSRSGLDAKSIESKILADCRNAGDFLRIVMEEIARSQNVDRWADCTPDHLLYVPEIKKTIPDALVVHIIRDGRDVALSLEKQGWIRPFPWESGRGLLVAALYWAWIVGRGREYGHAITPDYIEVHFEDLVQEPRRVLAKLSEFIDHDLDYDRILQVGIGSVRDPNTSFEKGKAEFNPVGRWKKTLPEKELAKLEYLIGPVLESLGYPSATEPESRGRLGLSTMRALHSLTYDSKLWAKKHVLLSRYLMSKDLSWL